MDVWTEVLKFKSFLQIFGITMVYGHPNCPCLICLCMSFSHAYQGMSNAYHMLTSSDELNLPGLMVSIISIGFLIYTNIFLSSIGLCLKCLWASKVKCYYYAVFTPSLPPFNFFLLHIGVVDVPPE